MATRSLLEFSMTPTTAPLNLTTGQYNYTEADLEELNDKRAKTLVPAMVVLGILMIIGIIGNTLVCYVFCCKLKSGTQNFLIVCLAVFDMLSCTIAIPNEIADMRFYYMFESEMACKIMRSIITFTSIGSILTLLVIAIDRYRKICKPFRGQMGMKHVRLSLIPVVGGATMFAWPSFPIYGIRTTETEVLGLMGRACTTSDSMVETIYPLIYNMILFLCFVILAVVLIILYTFVLRETKRHNRYLKRNSDFNLPSNSLPNSDDSHGSGENSSPFTMAYKSSNGDNTAHVNKSFVHENPDSKVTSDLGNSEHAHVFPVEGCENVLDESYRDRLPSVSFSQRTDITEVDCHEEPLTHVSVLKSSISGSKRPSLAHSNGHVRIDETVAIAELHGRLKKRDSTVSASSKSSRTGPRRSKTTVIAFLVTLVFILSFLPHLSLMISKLIVTGFDYSLSGASLVAYNIFLRSYFVNCVANPFIYGALNFQFKSEVKKLLKKLNPKLCC